MLCWYVCSLHGYSSSIWLIIRLPTFLCATTVISAVLDSSVRHRSRVLKPSKIKSNIYLFNTQPKNPAVVRAAVKLSHTGQLLLLRSLPLLLFLDVAPLVLRTREQQTGVRHRAGERGARLAPWTNLEVDSIPPPLFKLAVLVIYHVLPLANTVDFDHFFEMLDLLILSAGYAYMWLSAMRCACDVSIYTPTKKARKTYVPLPALRFVRPPRLQIISVIRVGSQVQG